MKLHFFLWGMFCRQAKRHRGKTDILNEWVLRRPELNKSSITYSLVQSLSHGLPWWLSRGRICLQCRGHRICGFDPWVREIPWRRKWQLTPVFLSGKFHGQRSMVSYSPWSYQEPDTTSNWTHTQSFSTARRQAENIGNWGVLYWEGPIGSCSVTVPGTVAEDKELISPLRRPS